MKLSKRANRIVEQLVEQRLQELRGSVLKEDPEMETRVNHRAVTDTVMQSTVLTAAIENGVEKLYRDVLFNALPAVIAKSLASMGTPTSPDDVKDALASVMSPDVVEAEMADMMGEVDALVASHLEDALTQLLS